MFPKFFDVLHEWKGRIIAYGGGSSVSAFSGAVAANAQQAVDHTASSPDITTANVISIIGLIFIGCRLIFDVVVWLDERRQKRGEKDGCEATD
ncbi:hypothetical protein [Vibrio aestuarianus]|uniref:Holin n=1 Tax=Vibrio aestuarianus TaxID=28171 RepID=A0ABD7YQI9_9VIBR|nr:hypothetical protein [Vibrio aestuarianus]WGK87240.1 hypothetical protein PYE67_14040 [Vibrio aestuarianus]CAH8235341.1 conserved exported hypothetical protein [Vibrio aestuarianus]HDZ9327775.1 hypothetical protein [Vibrio cholerae]